jgi:hypothetical protein
MSKKEEVKLTEGSRYKIISIGGKDQALETEGVFKGFSTLGIDEIGLIMVLTASHGEMQGKTRIVPLHAILAIDILDVKEGEKKDVSEDTSHYYG